MIDNLVSEGTEISTGDIEPTEKETPIVVDTGYQYITLGGAISLTGAFEFLESRDEQRKVDALLWLFRDVQDNIFSSPDMELPEKVIAMGDLIDELSAELAQIREKTLFVKVKDAIFPFHKRQEAEEQVKLGGVSLFRNKETSSLEFIAIASNNYLDRDSPPDIITKAAHEEYAKWVKNTGLYPELRLWHLPESRLGKVTWVEEVNGFLVTGGIVDKESEPLLLKAVNEYKFTAISMGFFPLEEKDHVIDMYRTFEVSILPEDAAANPWTSIDLL